MKDSYHHKGLRSRMITHLRNMGIHNEHVLRAMMVIPRHLFLDSAFAEWAYAIQAFPIEAEQTISNPYTVAVQSSLLNIIGREKVLEIGTGSGYQACVLAQMGAKVYSIERQERLYHRTSKLLYNIGYGNVRTLLGDGYKGSPRFAPFDHIIVTAGAEKIPGTLLDQLKIGGSMIIPVGPDDDKEMLRIRKVSERKFTKESFGSFRFVPFLEGIHRSV